MEKKSEIEGKERRNNGKGEKGKQSEWWKIN